MGIDTGSVIGYNAAFPIAGVSQPSTTFRDNFSIIKTAIERLQTASSSPNSLFSVTSTQSSDGQVQFVVGFNGNALQLPLGSPTITATIGMMRYNAGAVEIYDGSQWNALAVQNGASVLAALGFAPAPLDSPHFTGIPVAPTASLGTNSTQIATTAFVRSQIDNLVNGAPGVLDSLAELSAALNNDPNFATHIITGLAGKADLAHTHSQYLQNITASSGTHSGNNISIVGTNGISTSITGDTLTIALNSSIAHGNLGGGSLHTLAVANGDAGFMSGSDKAKLDSISGNGYSFSRFIISNTQGLNVRDATQTNDSFVFSSDSPIVLNTNGNELHFSFTNTDTAHGLRSGGQLHALVAPNGDAGFMSGSDKAKLDQLTASVASQTVKGYMSPQDKARLDNLVLQTPGGYVTISINGKTYQIPGNSALNFSGVNGIDLDYSAGDGTVFFVLNRIGNMSISDLTTLATNYNESNDQDSDPVTAPVILADGTAIDHTINTNGSANVSFEWTWTGNQTLDEGEDSFDGFLVYVYQSTSPTPYVQGTDPSNEYVQSVPAQKRNIVLYGVAPDLYYSFFVQSYRDVAANVASSGIIQSAIVHSTAAGEFPYRPSANVAFAGDVTGTIDGTAATTVKTNAANAWYMFSGVGNTLPAGNVEFNFAASGSKGGNALNTNAVGSQSATTIQNAVINFNTRNDRNAAPVVIPTVASDGTAVDHTINADSSANISFEWSWTGTNDDIDGFIITVYQSTSTTPYTIGSSPADEQVNYVTPEKRAFILYGVPSNLNYTFYVQAYRIVDNDISSTGFIRTAAVKSTRTEENPYLPTNAPAFSGDVTGTINGVPAATVQSSATNAWSKFSGVGNTLPAGAVEFNFATSSTKGGNATNTDAVGSQAAATVQNSIINFNTRNDRNSSPVVLPVVASDGTAVDHTINTDGSANISFEWSWTGVSGDIDGFIITVYQSYTNSTPYLYGTYVSDESVEYITPEKRACNLYGVPADAYYTFFVDAYRIVDNDISATGYLRSGPIKSTRTDENPYRPTANIAFAGDLSGTINGVPAATVQTAAQNAWSKFSGVGNTIPAGNVEFNFAASGSKGGNALSTDTVGNQSAATVQNAVINFNSRNDRLATVVVNPVVPIDGTAVDHVINTNGSASISFEWTWGGAATDIDGFIVFTYVSNSSSPYILGTDPANEQVDYVTPEKRAFIIYGIPPDLYYTFYVQAYRIVDVDISASGILKSAAINSTRTDENPYRPSIAPVFAGDITGTINGTSVSSVLQDVSDTKNAVAGIDAGSTNLVKNVTFSNYTATTGAPVNWTSTVYGTIARVAGTASSYAALVTSGANVQGYFSQKVGSASSAVITTSQWLVLEATVRVTSGAFTGSGLLLRVFDNANGSDDNMVLNFATDPDSTGSVVGAGATNKLYSFSKTIQVQRANATYFELFALGHFPGIGSVGASNSIEFHRVAVRPASSGEITALQSAATVSGLSSTVSTYSSSIADLTTRTQAYWTTTAVSGSNRAQLTIHADANNGAGVDITGDVTIAGNLLVDGTLTTTKLATNSVTSFIAVANYNSYVGSGSGTNPGSGASGPGGSFGCVAIESLMPSGKKAGDLVVGDELLVLSDDQSTYVKSSVEDIRIITQPCYHVTTISGVKLVASVTTPITLRDGSVISIMQLGNRELPVLDQNGFRWESVLNVDFIGDHQVALISARDGTYAAGEQFGSYIFTHNKQVSSDYS